VRPPNFYDASFLVLFVPDGGSTGVFKVPASMPPFAFLYDKLLAFLIGVFFSPVGSAPCGGVVSPLKHPQPDTAAPALSPVGHEF